MGRRDVTVYGLQVAGYQETLVIFILFVICYSL